MSKHYRPLPLAKARKASLGKKMLSYKKENIDKSAKLLTDLENTEKWDI